MTVKLTPLLNEAQTLQKIRRIAYEIFEQNFEEEELIVAGIKGNGSLFAELLCDELKKITEMQIVYMDVTVDKKSPLQSTIKLSLDAAALENKAVILVDDVLYTGRTLAYSLNPFLNVRIKKLQTAILVDRGHRHFPISADYIGYRLSTTLQDHIMVNLEEEPRGVFMH